MLAKSHPQPHIIPMLAEAQEAQRGAGAVVARVGVTRLVLTDFRNYREARLTLGTASVVLTGPNGAGKTNLLEAISLLAPGRGLRRAQLGSLDRRPPPGAAAPGPWAVAARVCRPEGAIEVGTGRDPTAPADAPRPRRLVKIDGDLVR